MFEYALVLLPVSMLAFAAAALPLPAQRTVATALVMVLTAFAAMRGYVGTDTGAYHAMFENYAAENTLNLVGIIEPLFALLLKGVSLFSNSSFAFTVTISLVQAALLLMIIARHQNPALFLAIYTSTFYLNFHFNILRASVAALLLLLAVDYLKSRQDPKFIFAGILSVLSHYSSIAFFLPMTAIRRSLTTGLLLFVTVSAATVGLLHLLLSDARLLQYVTYLAVIDTADTAQFGAGLIALFALYVAIYLCTISRSNFGLLTFLLVAWLGLRLLSTHFLFVDRIEVVINLVLLYLMVGYTPVGQVKVIRTVAILLLVMLNLYGTLSGLEQSDQAAADGFDADPSRFRSTYLPYKFIWDEE